MYHVSFEGLVPQVPHQSEQQPRVDQRDQGCIPP